MASRSELLLQFSVCTNFHDVEQFEMNKEYMYGFGPKRRETEMSGKCLGNQLNAVNHSRGLAERVSL